MSREASMIDVAFAVTGIPSAVTQIVNGTVARAMPRDAARRRAVCASCAQVVAANAAQAMIESVAQGLIALGTNGVRFPIAYAMPRRAAHRRRVRFVVAD